MKTPFEGVREMFLENVQSQKDLTRFVYTQRDKLLVWLVGFSIGGIALIVSNITTLNELLCYCIIKLVLILLTLSVFSGIVCRMAEIKCQQHLGTIEMFLHTAFSNKEMENIYSSIPEDEEDADIILKTIKEDFGVDLIYLKDKYDTSDNEYKKTLLKSFKDYHKKMSKRANVSFASAQTFAKETYQKAFDLTPEELDKLWKFESGKHLKFNGIISQVSFFICCGTFVTAVIILCVKI